MKKASCVLAGFILTTICVVLNQTSVHGQASPIWKNLEPGPYAVGFRTVEKYDYSRIFRPKKDYFGRPLPGERARPIQICIWYPAKKTHDGQRMILNEYVFPYPEDSRFFDFLSTVQNREITTLHRLTNNDRDAVLSLLNLKTGAVRDAEPSGGSFPLIIYEPELGSGISADLVLCEYLASHGFVIAAAHSVGTTELNPRFSQRDMETLIRDKELIFSDMREFEGVNIDRLGIMGSGSGGLRCLLLKMRNSDIDAVVFFQGPRSPEDSHEILRENPYYDSRKMNSPLLCISADGAGSAYHSPADSLGFCTRYLLRFGESADEHLSGYALLASLRAEGEERPSGTTGAEYNTACRFILNFFNAFLNEDEGGLRFLQAPPEKNGIKPGLVSVEIEAAEDLPPTPEQFINIVSVDGVQEAHKIFEKFKDSGYVLFDEPVFNIAGYQLLQTGRIDDAILIFEMNSRAYPRSANTWDSLAEACEAAGRNEQAIKYLKKALEVLPVDTTTSDELKEAIRIHVNESLERLGG
jgi:dienelactone hydrolase